MKAHQKRKKKSVQSADFPLAPSLTEEIKKDLLAFLDTYPDEFQFSYLREQVFSKYVGPETDPSDVRRQRAIDKWLKTELTNADTNHRLLFTDPEYEIIPGVSYEKFMNRMRLVVAQILFDKPSPEVLYGTFSGGASTSHGRSEGNPALKFLDKADATPSAWNAILNLIEDCPIWKEHIDSTWQQPRFVDGNVLFTVPKNTTIDRCAAKEPDLNMFAQKGIGNLIRKRLKWHGIDLNDQSINAKLAQIGSRDGSLMTIDLSSASDSVSTRLVFETLPVDWFLLMNDIRSPYTEIDGELHENHMFSSMGNGFTFELESMLFWAIVRSVTYFTGTRGAVSVYGDDIIAPSSVYEPLVQALSYLGFSVNPDKSFHEGPFRESCGKHWYNGYDVTPFYIKEPIGTLTRLIHFLNQLTKWAGPSKIYDPRILPIWRKYAKLVPQDLWGGQDVSSILALVSGDMPRKQLVSVTVDVSYDHMGGYLFWLRSASTRVQVLEPIVTSKVKKVLHLYRIRRNSQAVSYDLPLLSIAE